jgi:hypothetical protein
MGEADGTARIEEVAAFLEAPEPAATATPSA